MPQEHIYALFDYMPKLIKTLIATYEGFTPQWNLTVANNVKFCNSYHLLIDMCLIYGINFISVICILLGAVLLTNICTDIYN